MKTNSSVVKKPERNYNEKERLKRQIKISG